MQRQGAAVVIQAWNVARRIGRVVHRSDNQHGLTVQPPDRIDEKLVALGDVVRDALEECAARMAPVCAQEVVPTNRERQQRWLVAGFELRDLLTEYVPDG